MTTRDEPNPPTTPQKCSSPSSCASANATYWTPASALLTGLATRPARARAARMIAWRTPATPQPFRSRGEQQCPRSACKRRRSRAAHSDCSSIVISGRPESASIPGVQQPSPKALKLASTSPRSGEHATEVPNRVGVVPWLPTTAQRSTSTRARQPPAGLQLSATVGKGPALYKSQWTDPTPFSLVAGG
jgi:hypothetical protein